MRKILGLLLVVGMVSIQPLGAQTNFSGSDAFASVTGNWSTPTTSGGGGLTVNSGVLNFTTGPISTGGTATAYQNWTLNTGSYTADWQVQIDFVINTTFVGGQTASWALLIGNNSDTTDYVNAKFSYGYMQQMASQTAIAEAAIYTNGASGVTGGPLGGLTNTTGSLRVTFTASSQTIGVWFDGDGAANGYSFTNNVLSASIGPSGQNWGMTPSDTFGLRVQATTGTTGTPTSTMLEGVFTADNFVATGSASAIPEPSTNAALAGALALLAGLVKFYRSKK